MSKKIIAVHGLGSIGMRHARNLIRMGHDVCGYDEDKSKIDQLLATGGRADWPEHIDGVVIATPTPVHAATLDIYQKLADVPIFVEKPIAAEPVATTKNIIMVGYNLRFHACVKKARDWLRDGIIGTPVWSNLVCAQYSSKPDYLRDGVIMNWSHEIDLALYLLGPGVLQTCAVDQKETIADLTIWHYPCQSTVHLDYLTLPEIRQTIIVGTEGQIVMDLVNRRCWLRDKRGIYVDEINHPIDSWTENYYEEMAAFCDRIDGKETIGCSAQEALDVLTICLQARKMARA
jgi:predicted dehydrogenase